MTVDRHYFELATAQSLQVAALAALVAVAVRAFARNRPHLAHALWLIVLVKCLTPPVWSSPTGVFCWLQPAPAEAHGSNAADRSSPIDEFTSTALDDESGDLATPMFAAAASADDNDDNAPSDSSAAIPATFAAIEPPSSEPIDSPINDNSRTTATGPALLRMAAAWLPGIWLTGSLTMIAVSVVRGFSCWRLVRGSRRLLNPRLERRVRVLCRQLGVRQAVRLTITASRVGPAVVGLLRPTILLPAAIVQGRNAVELEPILAHELVHVRRGDLWVGLVQAIAQAVWWFHPLVWLAGRRIAREAERCCDEEVIAALACPPARYAKSLLDVLDLKQRLTAVPVFPGVRPVEITSQRLERIMTLGQGCRRRTPWWCWVVMLLVAALALPGAALVVGADEPPAGALTPADAEPTAAKRLRGPGTATQPAVAEAYSAPLSPYGGSSSSIEAPAAEIEYRYTLTDELSLVAKELGISGAAAKQYLLNHLQATLGGKQSADATPLGQWTDDTLVVRQSPDGHQRIANERARMRRYGCKQLEFQVWFAWGPPAEIEKVANRWTLLPTTVPREEAPVNGAPALTLPNLVDAGDPPDNQASFVVEKKLPVVVELMDDRRFGEVLAALQADRRTNVMQAPKMTLYAGQTGTVLDCTQSPFVVGLHAGQPRIRVLRQGRALRVLPILRGDVLRLDYELTRSTILSVENMTLAAHDGHDAVTLQVPEVVKSRVESSVELPPGKSLLVGGLSTIGTKGEKESVLMLLKARAIMPKGVAATVEPAAYQQMVSEGVNSGARLKGDLTIAEDQPQPSRAASIEERLKTLVALKFKDAPFGQVMECLGKMGQLDVRLDPRGLAEEGVTDKTPVTTDLGEDVTLKTAFDRVLTPLHLGFVIKDDVLKITSEQMRDGEVYTCVYSVADLVKPKPSVIKVGETDPRNARAEPDFKSLIDLIKSTIQPDSWDDKLGAGAIQPHVNNLSLIISQTQQVHEQIAELIEQLRRLQDLKVSLQVESVPAEVVDEWLKRKRGSDSTETYILLKPHEASSLLGDGALSGLRLMRYNGQTADLGRSTLQAVIAADRRTVRLTVVVDKEGDAKTIATVPDGHSLLLIKDRPPVFSAGSDEAGRAVASPVYMLITPRIIVREREEAAAKPRAEISNFCFLLSLAR